MAIASRAVVRPWTSDPPSLSPRPATFRTGASPAVDGLAGQANSSPRQGSISSSLPAGRATAPRPIGRSTRARSPHNVPWEPVQHVSSAAVGVGEPVLEPRTSGSGDKRPAAMCASASRPSGVRAATAAPEQVAHSRGAECPAPARPGRLRPFQRRGVRANQERAGNIQVYDIIAVDTLDEDVIMRHESKREVMDLLLDAMKRRG